MTAKPQKATHKDGVNWQDAPTVPERSIHAAKRAGERRKEIPPEISTAAAALGRIKTAKKAESSRRNLEKANAALSPEMRRERARKAAAASSAKLTPEERREKARRAVLARWKKAKNSKDNK